MINREKILERLSAPRDRLLRSMEGLARDNNQLGTREANRILLLILAVGALELVMTEPERTSESNWAYLTLTEALEARKDLLGRGQIQFENDGQNADWTGETVQDEAPQTREVSKEYINLPAVSYARFTQVLA